MIQEDNYCELCGVEKSYMSFVRSKNICKKCHEENKREAFLQQGGMPDSRFRVTMNFKLNSEECELLTGQSVIQNFNVHVVSRGANEYEAIQSAQKKMILRFKLLAPQFRDDIKIKAITEEVSSSTPLTLFSEIYLISVEINDQLFETSTELFPEDDLADYSDEILKATVNTVADFLKDNPDKKFYAFAFDCNAEYGELLLAMNTEDDFSKTSSYYIDKWDYKEADLLSLRVNTGDWAYQGFNLDYPYWKECEAFARKIEAYIMDDETDYEAAENLVEKLLCMFSETLIRFEDTDVFKSIPKEEIFVTFAVDHEESSEDAIARMEKIRN